MRLNRSSLIPLVGLLILWGSELSPANCSRARMRANANVTALDDVVLVIPELSAKYVPVDSTIYWIHVTTLALGVTIVTLSNTKIWQTNGYLPGLACALGWTLMNNYVRMAGSKEDLPFGVCVLVRTFCLSIGSFVLGKLNADPVTFIPETAELQIKVFARALAGVVSVISLFLAFNHAPVIYCLGLFYTNSIFAACIGYFFLSERLGATECLAMLVGVFAVMMILLASRDSSTLQSVKDWPLVGLGCAGLAALAEAIAGVVNRSMRGRVHYSTLMLAQAVLGFLISTGSTFLYPEHFLKWPLTGLQCRILIGIVASSFMVQLTLNQAYLLEKTGPVQMFMNVIVVVPQLILDAVQGYRLSTTMWLGLMLLMLYLTISWSAQCQRQTSQAIGVESLNSVDECAASDLIENRVGCQSKR